MREDGSIQTAENRADVDISIKASMKTFLQCAVATVLEAWDDSHRYCSFQDTSSNLSMSSGAPWFCSAIFNH
jgi:hypothetical protein